MQRNRGTSAILNGSGDSPLIPLPSFMGWPATRLFDFSKPQSERDEPLTLTQAEDWSAVSYQDYLRQTLPRSWDPNARHIQAICEKLDDVTSGKIDRLAIHMPPRHAKSESVTVRYPVYRLKRDPELSVLVTGYNERFAQKFGRKTRKLARLQRVPLDSEKAASDEWHTAEGGYLMARGVGSPPTGTGFKLICIDDPVRKREDAESEVYREKVWDWYTDDLYTRLEPGGAIILTMTLWHEDDLGARAIASEPGRWTVLKLPAICEEETDVIGRAVGQALWPDRYDVEALERIHAVMSQNEGERSWRALYQQDPRAREGSIFRVDEFRIEDNHPAIMRQVRHWDLASSEKKQADFTAGVLLGIDENNRYWVLDVQRGQWPPDVVRDRILQQARIDGRGTIIHLPQDPGQAGKAQSRDFVSRLAGFSVAVGLESGDKVTRAMPAAAQTNAGNVSIVRAPWNRPFIEEHRSFPAGVHDDQVDAFSGAFNHITVGMGYLGTEELAW